MTQSETEGGCLRGPRVAAPVAVSFFLRSVGVDAAGDGTAALGEATSSVTADVIG